MRTVDWAKVEKQAKGMKMDALVYTMNDCIAARDASKGWNPENENYYQDLATVYSSEIRRRQEKPVKSAGRKELTKAKVEYRKPLDVQINYAIGHLETARTYARSRLETALKYGDDMLSSKELCINDAINLMKKSVADIEAYFAGTKKNEILDL